VERVTTRTDAELIRAAEHDADAFAELYDRYARDAVAWVRRGGVQDPDVVDVVAELFAQAWRSRRRFRDPGDGSAGAWLYGICRHLIARHRRRGRADDSARRRLGMDVDHGGTPVTARKHVSLGLRALRQTLDPEKP
jgi:DNA-directed RNA polymerase specialized sigma24 family protein